MIIKKILNINVFIFFFFFSKINFFSKKIIFPKYIVNVMGQMLKFNIDIKKYNKYIILLLFLSIFRNNATDSNDKNVDKLCALISKDCHIKKRLNASAKPT